MPDIRLVAITQSGEPGEAIALPSGIAEVMSATAAMYQSSGFEPPWIGYLAISEGSIVGTCAFKASPTHGRVEIAYFTFSGYEGRGFATAMAKHLVSIAKAERTGIVVTAQTLPVRNASNNILEKLGFKLAGRTTDAEAGEVWEWHLE